MTKIIVKANGTNLRKAPDTSTSANVLCTLRGGVSLEGTLNDEWYVVPTYIHRDVVNVVPEPLPIPPDSIPYRSQWDSDANNRTADCGQTCVAMLCEWRGITVEVNDLRFQSSSSGLSNGADLVKNFDSVGIGAIWKYLSSSENAILGDICLIKYGGFNRSSVQDKNYYGWHWVVFIEDKGNSVIVHDPDWWGSLRDRGAFKEYSKSEWNKAFIPYTSAGKTIVRMT